MHKTHIIDIRQLNIASSILLPQIGSVAAGFPSPAADYFEEPIDLNSLIKHPSSTFWGRVSGSSLNEAGIHDNDLLIIDKSIKPVHGKYAVCCIDGEFTAKKIHFEGKRLFLMPENKDFKPIEVTEDNSFFVWGVIILCIKILG